MSREKGSGGEVGVVDKGKEDRVEDVEGLKKVPDGARQALYGQLKRSIAATGGEAKGQWEKPQNSKNKNILKNCARRPGWPRKHV